MDNTKHYFQLKGKTAEKIVQNLAQKTFLIDWCYPNPTLETGNELCDLLVIFDNVVIIWQIKDLKLNKSGKYRKSEVDRNLRQLSGARRQMFELKNQVKLSNTRREKEIFNPNKVSEVFLISVLLGEEEDYYSALEEIKGHNVHVFSKEFTEIALNELDTISDFCAYLRAKEKLFTEKERSIIINGGEKELLALYLRDGRSFKNYEKADKIFINGDIWSCLMQDPRFIKKKELDKISYGWDGIINRAHEGSLEYEFIARELARPNRFERRFLSKVFFEAHVMAHESTEGNLLRRIMPSEGITYCFLFMDDSEPREIRKAMLLDISYFARGKFPQNKKVLGIATERHFNITCSYDFVFFDKPNWYLDDQKKVEKIQKETGMFVNPTVGRAKEDEYTD